MTQQQIAENYVRGELPELMELSKGCETSKGKVVGTFESEGRYSYVMGSFSTRWDGTRGDATCPRYDRKDFTIIGHPIQLQHWLRVLELLKREVEIVFGTNSLWVRKRGFRIPEKPQSEWIKFNLTMGSPNGEENYKAFNDIVRISTK